MGADGGFEWIELYNGGAEAVSLGGWQIEGGTSTLGVDVVFDASVELGSRFLFGGGRVFGCWRGCGGRFVVGNAGSSSGHYSIGGLFWCGGRHACVRRAQ